MALLNLAGLVPAHSNIREREWISLVTMGVRDAWSLSASIETTCISSAGHPKGQHHGLGQLLWYLFIVNFNAKNLR